MMPPSAPQQEGAQYEKQDEYSREKIDADRHAPRPVMAGSAPQPQGRYIGHDTRDRAERENRKQADQHDKNALDRHRVRMVRSTSVGASWCSWRGLPRKATPNARVKERSAIAPIKASAANESTSVTMSESLLCASPAIMLQ
jgi:hypothetical protein